MSGEPGCSSSKNPYLMDKSEIIKAHHKFLWDDKDQNPDTYEKRLAKTYYDDLFKEYCIADLSRYKSNQIALRWRTKNEVLSNKGSEICGNKKCTSKENLKVWEVNFKYIEHGQNHNALVKLALCVECSIMLNYHKKHNLFGKSSSKSKKRKSKEGSISPNQKIKVEVETEDESQKEEKAKEDNIWTNEDPEEKTEMNTEEKIDAYLSDLF
ncbi:protein FRA10AC1-like isoform X2 [Trichogramma pretiosum]|uniref:protein FRA10AC1-like isoform X2 n=1 Tax=Trichogramma pretiosum TaxID=7493 RepID=UPI0006C9BE7D|nr:protein FRA10AC1-like isoform X2 [Trichogramma pretiosum]